jgi:TrmH family RNA methyltransferase
MQEPDLSRFAIVLCRAEESGNVGSVCRAMKTMGLERLILAGCPAHDESRVRTMAVHAFDLYEKAARFADLAGALAEFGGSAGFTRRRGAGRKVFSLSIADFAAREAQRPGSMALVFGNEKSGLSGEELDLCSLAVHIPTSEAFPSLNLSQAVQIACHELRSAALGSMDGSALPVSRAETDAAVGRIGLCLSGLGFFKITDGARCRDFLRDTVERAGMTTSELRYFEALFRKMASLAERKSSAP